MSRPFELFPYSGTFTYMKVKTGLEILLANRTEILKNRRVGVVVNPASVDSRLRSTVNLLSAHPEIDLTAVFGPQHGTRGETQDNMIEWEDFRDPDRGLPVFSLYGKTRKPTAEMLAGVDTIVFDLQDVGARYYTYIQTLALVMEACSGCGKELVVLDRPNPINGVDLEGPVLSPHFRSFVGLYPLPIRHGMTMGEIAEYLNREFRLGCDLKVIPMEGWQRSMFFDETGLPWIMPSPNMPTLDTAIIYPGMCLLEGTNLSEGRGTTRPFELCGAPWIEPEDLAETLHYMKLPGVRFRPVYFEPTFHKWSGQVIGGVQIHVLDRRVFLPFLTGLAVIQSFRTAAGSGFRFNDPPYEYEYEKLPFDILCGTDRIRIQMEKSVPLNEIQNAWMDSLRKFSEKRKQYLLY